ncbi:MAG: glycosyltransferase [Bacteriovorax sp.]
MSKKNIWILNYQIDDLQSVGNISSNLVSLYRELPPSAFDVSLFELQDMERSESANLEHRNWLVRFKENPPHHVIIVHPHVINHVFLSAILNVQTSFSPQFVFHVFGNFTRQGAVWFNLNHLMLNKNIQFVVASTCYLELLKTFVPEKNLSLLPFPVFAADNKDIFSSFQQCSDTMNVLYSGRYHDQKNVTFLMETLGKISDEIAKKIHLTLVVYFDDFNPTTLNTPKRLGEQYRHFLSAINGLDKKITVTLMPHTDIKNLYKLYSQNDVFMSFSTFLDEDYGCSVIESLVCGTPSIVSRWGGYKDFSREFPEDCLGLEVTIEREGFYIDLSKLMPFLELITKRTIHQRIQLSRDAMAVFGNKKLLESAELILAKEGAFSGLDPSLAKLSRELKMDNKPDAIEAFKRVYKSFWEI